MTHDRPPAAGRPEELGGDPACWLDRVCEICGSFVEDGDEHDCAPSDGPSSSRTRV